MITNVQNSYNVSFNSRNRDIRSAQQILHKVKSEYAAASPHIAHLLTQKLFGRDLSLQSYTNKKLYALRQTAKLDLDSELEYSRGLLHLIKRARVMNCKENSELAELIALINNCKNFMRVCFGRILPDGEFADIDHVVLLLNQKMPKGKVKIDKYYAEDFTEKNSFFPSRKAIVVDPLFGIVDYWENAVISYQNLCPDLTLKNLVVHGKKPILKKHKNIKQLKAEHPELLILQKQKDKKQPFLSRVFGFISGKTGF